MKRRRPDGQRHPLQRRLLAVPTSEAEWTQVQESNAYSNEEDWFQDLLYPPRERRPLPSTHILSSSSVVPAEAAAKRPEDSSLLKDFYRAVGIDVAAKDDPQEETNEDEAIKEDIDNPAFSTLTLGQHQRYLQLTSPQQTERRKDNERKELKSLRKVVNSEQHKYKYSLKKFFLDNKERFLIGFRSTHQPASAFCRWSSSNQSVINGNLKTDISMPSHFGKCRQIISFPFEAICSLDMEALSFQVVHQTHVADMVPSKLPSINNSVPPPDKELAPAISWLRDDTKARELAKEYKANILTTAETLEALLQLPGQYDSRWILYASSLEQSDASDETRLTILDIPIAQPLLPRKCLEKGFREGVQQLIRPSNQDPGTFQYTYSLWTLPSNTVASRRSPIQVLVRSAVRSMDKDGFPISIRCHAEYFPERGVEEPTIYEKALWILDQVLFQHKVKSRFARIHAQTGQILGLEETSIAHAFAAATDEASNPLIHWQALIQVLQSIPTIDSPSSLVCLPNMDDSQSSARSASVHVPVDEYSSSVAVNLQPILEQADTVVLNAEALRNCSREWKWQFEERIPNTFPVRHNSGKAGGKK